MAVTTYRAANFQDNLTLNMPGGTGTGNSTWTLNQSTASLPSGTFKALVYTSTGTFVTTREIIQCAVTGANTVLTSTRGDESTTAIDHPNGSFFAIVNTAGMENAQNEAIAELYLGGNTTTVTAGEAYAATTTVSGVTAPTLLYQDPSTGKYLRATSATATPGWAQIIAMAYELSSGDGASVRVYLPGSVVTCTGLTNGRNYFPSATVGGLEAFSSTTTLYYKLVGSAISTTLFHFFPTSNTTLIESNQIYLTAGEALTRFDLCYVKVSDGLVYKADADAQESGQVKNFCVCNYATSGSGQTSRFYTSGAKTQVLGTYSTGQVLYPSGTAGQVTATRGAFSRPIGIALSASTVYLFPGTPNENIAIERVTAGENWTVGNLLYQKKSDGRYYLADTDVAESGICEFPAVAFATHTGGAASVQLVYMPGSLIRGVFGFAISDRLFPSATAGAYVANTPPSYDTFWRVVGNAPEASVFGFNPQQMEFLPTGMQEKGACGGQDYGSGGEISGNVTCFKKIMVNTPSSITITLVDQVNTDLTAVSLITRFGFLLTFRAAAGTNPYRYVATYQTVGN